VALKIADSGCDDVGLRTWHDVWSYAVLAMTRNAGSDAIFRSVDVENVSARYLQDKGTPCLLLQMGPFSGKLPAWAAGWRLVADHSALGVRGAALFAPSE
jgi:hypothetical protein